MTATAATAPNMRQRADLTYKQNLQHGRHGWLRLTPAYSVRLVDEVLAEFGAGARSVFEPFSGTGTTPLCAAYRGITAVSTDINPFLIWLGRAKCAHYTDPHRRAFEAAIMIDIGNDVARRADRRMVDVVPRTKQATLLGADRDENDGPARLEVDHGFGRCQQLARPQRVVVRAVVDAVPGFVGLADADVIEMSGEHD